MTESSDVNNLAKSAKGSVGADDLGLKTKLSDSRNKIQQSHVSNCVITLQRKFVN